ncbi:hypothetical protein WN55_00259 [Dufourea novaeangliae]|uniref:Uncharacterized protein n=1 Tax=Dufourea novaeangliae TaxID=178035 RepID=A0A154PCS3_DUFNO|nr:hypothetical protein WN55_00259 [Dufourea novaeangliae]
MQIHPAVYIRLEWCNAPKHELEPSEFAELLPAIVAFPVSEWAFVGGLKWYLGCPVLRLVPWARVWKDGCGIVKVSFRYANVTRLTVDQWTTNNLLAYKLAFLLAEPDLNPSDKLSSTDRDHQSSRVMTSAPEGPVRTGRHLTVSGALYHSPPAGENEYR